MKHISSLLVISTAGPPARSAWQPRDYVKSWLAKGRRHGNSTTCAVWSWLVGWYLTHPLPLLITTDYVIECGWLPRRALKALVNKAPKAWSVIFLVRRGRGAGVNCITLMATLELHVRRGIITPCSLNFEALHLHRSEFIMGRTVSDGVIRPQTERLMRVGVIRTSARRGEGGYGPMRTKADGGL